MKVRVDLQYVDDCPKFSKLRENLAQAVRGIEDHVEVSETNVLDEATAAEVMFRGSPTLLINGKDVVGMPAPNTPSLSCRIYQDGLPSAELIRWKIDHAL
jgi:hypothetical protein